MIYIQDDGGYYVEVNDIETGEILYSTPACVTLAEASDLAHEWTAAELATLRKQVETLREALVAARSHCVSWQGEPREQSCTIHTAVINCIDAALSATATGETM